MGIQYNAKCCKFGFAVFFALASACLIIVGVLEKLRFDPFYTPMKCTHFSLAIRLSSLSYPPGNPFGFPAGNPPYGLYGPVSTLVHTCENPNEYDISTKKDESVSRLYLPNLTNPIDGKPYLEIAQSYLAHDVTLKAKGTAKITSTVNGSTPLAAFGAIAAFAQMRGYVPLYTKIIASGQSCLRLFGIEMCGKETKETWCGTLGGTCFVGIPGTNISEPAICAYTRFVCRSSEAEMKTLTTAKNLGVTILATVPCPPSSGLPAGTNCSIPEAVGIDKNMKMQPIPGYVDGPHPSKEDIEKGESAIGITTSLAIALGAVLTVLFCGLGKCSLLFEKTKCNDRQAAQGAEPAPAILTSTAAQTAHKNALAV